ncbi:endonuclease 8-like 1 [Babylonia areolata]|uniref:endonuclease 8-like 1 n=1 Tax=Babylonia areolata TaxID=304850 RepID=UPI003FD163DB
MPEGPELHLSSQFINAICKGRIFSGTVRKNPIHKCADVVWDAAAYTISSVSRGKELKVFLQSLKREADEKSNVEHGAVTSKIEAAKRLHLLFNFGMSGKFEFTSVSELPKHAHLSFFTKTDDMALSFVDYRRFGKWQVGADWSPDRGPCVLFEYPQFRSNVLNSLDNSAFNKPVCEVLLNQKYFNGIGNYLRAEICYRGGVRPFDQARAVFSALPDVPDDVKVKTEDGVKDTAKAKVKAERPDILELCNTIPLEVVGLGTSLYLPEDEHSDMSKFSLWLQCYYKCGMKNVADHNKRTMWYHGDPGPMLPRESGCKRRHGVYDKKLTKSGKKMKKEENVDAEDKQNDDSSTEKMKRCPKSSRQDKQGSPAKPKRITRTSLKTLVDESTKTSKTTTKVKKAPRKKSSSKAADEANGISGTKTISSKEKKQNARRVKGNLKSDEKDTKSKSGVRSRATRAAVIGANVAE